MTAKTEVNRSLGGMEELSEEELSALLGGKSGDPELTELADMAEELLTPHVLGQIRLTGKARILGYGAGGGHLPYGRVAAAWILW